MNRLHLIAAAAIALVAALVAAICPPGGGWRAPLDVARRHGLASIYLLGRSSQAAHVDGEKLVAASRAFSRDLQARGTVVPESVSIDELIRKGFLSRDAVRGFDGMKVTVTLAPDETTPAKVLVHAKMPDGEENAVMCDGSLQQARK